MNSRMDEFREFVRKYPKLKDDVRNGARTWQDIYEEWVLYGENGMDLYKYQDVNQEGNNNLNLDSIKSIVNYVQKINPDSIYRSLNTIQKVIQIFQTFGGKNKTTQYIQSPYDEWWN
mgnify:CR=1 FL=1|jgi:hypothetical protein